MFLLYSYIWQTAAHDGVKLWDLRKLKNFRNYSLYDQDTPTNSGIHFCILLMGLYWVKNYAHFDWFLWLFMNLAVEFDHSGSYLAIAGSDVRYVS